MNHGSGHENEGQTRRERIAPKLRATGSSIVRSNPGRSLAVCDRCAIEACPTNDGPADYGLCVGGQIVRVVEAKREDLDPYVAKDQARGYAENVSVPFCEPLQRSRAPFPESGRANRLSPLSGGYLRR